MSYRLKGQSRYLEIQSRTIDGGEDPRHSSRAIDKNGTDKGEAQIKWGACEREEQLTRHTVDGFEGPQDTDSTDRRQVNVLEVQGILHHPAKGETESEFKTIQDTGMTPGGRSER